MIELPPPLIVQIEARPAGAPGAPAPPEPWTSYVTPAATWSASALPIVIGAAGPAPPGLTALDLDAAVDIAARTWGLPACSGARFAVASHRALPGPLDADGRNDVIVHTADWPAPLTPGAAGHTVLFVTGDRIVEADIHLNARDFGFTLGKGPPKIDLRALITHELGHVLGIGHSAEARATMNAGVPAGIAGRSLEPDDVAAVCALYPTPGAPMTCTACPSGYVCVGHSCEVAAEPGTLGGPCSAETDVRRCEGAGDEARCLLTTAGERCAILCVGAEACGVGLACVKDTDGFGYCLPTGASFVTGDAGSDGGTDAGAADAGGGASPAVGCGCSLPVASPAPATAGVAGLLALVRRRRTRRR